MADDPTVALMRKVATIRKASGLTGKELSQRLNCSLAAARQIDRTVREGSGMRLDTFVRYCPRARHPDHRAHGRHGRGQVATP